MARIGIDLDGVVYDFVGSFRHHLITNCGFDPERVKSYERWEFYLDWEMTLEEFLRECHAGANAGIIFNHGDAFPGTREALQRIRDMGHTLHVVTDRSFGEAGTSEAATAKWVAKHLPKIESLTFSPDKTVANVDMMIDDKLQNYDALTRVGVDAWLLDRPWNAVPHDYYRQRVSTLAGFADMVDHKTLVYAQGRWISDRLVGKEGRVTVSKSEYSGDRMSRSIKKKGGQVVMGKPQPRPPVQPKPPAAPPKSK